MVREITVIDQIIKSIEDKKSFILDAGAGSGKTYSLIQTIEYLSKKQLRNNQKILCVTFTNVAKDEILSRIAVKTDKIIVSTLHEFIWNFIKQYQTELKKENEKLAEEKILSINNEISEAKRKIENPRSNTNFEKLEEIIVKNSKRLIKYENIDYKNISVEYDSYSAYYRGVISHDDVIIIFNKFLMNDFFTHIFLDTFPYILIDEYQDTNVITIENMLKAVMDNKDAAETVIGMYGDRMQMIYEKTTIDTSKYSINEIQKEDNFRTASQIVEANNNLRNDGLIQNTNAQNPKKEFEEIKFIYNKSEDTDLSKFIEYDRFHTYKRLYLANKNIAEEVGFESIRQVFYETYNRNANEKLLKLDDKLIFFIMENIVKFVVQIEGGDYYETIQKISDSSKTNFRLFINEMREQLSAEDQTVKKYIDFFINKKLIDKKILSVICENYEDIDEFFVGKLLDIDINEYKNLSRQIMGETSLATLHGVKGDEFDRVIVNIFEQQRWPEYNFDKFFIHKDISTSSVKKAHKLFYVACTRAKKSLIINYIADPESSIDSNELEVNIKKHFGETIEFIVLQIY